MFRIIHFSVMEHKVGAPGMPAAVAGDNVLGV